MVPAINTHFHDDVFGELIYWADVNDDGSGPWIKQEHLPLLGRTVSICLEAVAWQGPTERQKQIYLNFKKRQMEMKDGLQEALFAFYQNERPSYLEIVRDWWDNAEIAEKLPELTSSDQIWKLITPESLLIHLDSREVVDYDVSADFFISWNTVWNNEDRLAAYYHDWNVVLVYQL